MDPATGLWTASDSDLGVADVVPIAVTRTYRQGDANVRSFGVGMTLNYETYFYSDSGSYAYTDLIAPDGARIRYVRTSPGSAWSDAVFTATGTPGIYYNSTVIWNGNGWDLRTQDGSLYVFGENAPLQYFQDRFGNRTTLIRETPNGQVKAISSPNGRWVKFTYNAANVITLATDNFGRSVAYGYDVGNRLTSVTDPNGGVTTYIWDTTKNRITDKRLPRQQPSGPVLFHNVYDPTPTDPNKARLIQQTLADGTVFNYTYTVDANNKVTAADMKMTDAGHPGGILRKMTFNGDGYWLTDKLAFGTPQQQDLTAVRGGSTPSPDCGGNTPANSPTNALIAVTDALGRLTCQTYNSSSSILTRKLLANQPLNTVTYTYTYGAYGQLVTVTDPLTHTTTMGLDSLGRTTSIQNALGVGHTWTISPNADGQIGSITDPLSHMTSFAYNHGGLVQVTDALSRVSKLYTDPLGRTIQAQDPRANLWQWTYDKIWGVKIASDANGNAVTTNYNAGGLVSSVVDPRSASFTTQYAYDTKDRLITRTDPLSHNDTINTYDGFNNPLTTTDRKSQSATYTYDPLGRIATAVLADGHSLVYEWDGGNRLTKVSDTLSGAVNQVIRVYDGLDRLTSETVKQGPVAAPVTLGSVTYTYDNADRQATMTVSGQTQLCYVYDNADRLTTINQGTGANCATGLTTLESFTYDNADRRLTLTRPANGIVGTYAYTNADELLSISYKKGVTTVGDVTYTYDTAGRIASRGGSLFKSVLPTATTATAVYNADNQLTSWNGTTAAYDLNGNLTSDGTRAFTWDARDRLTGITGIASFVYDGVDRRQSVTQGATTVTALYDGYDPVQEQSPTGTVSANLQIGLGVDERFTRTKAGVTSTYLTDLLGSTVALADSAGVVQTSYGYDPYGVSSQTGAANDNQYQFTGRQNDGTGLYFYRARYYNPVWGRFISEDPIGLAGGIDQYAYVEGNPVSGIDPLGLAGGVIGNSKDEAQRRKQADCLGNCLAENSPLLAGSAAAIAAGQPVLSKGRGPLGGASPGTSLASKGFYKLFPQKLSSGRIWTPTNESFRTMTNKPGLAAGRWTPIVGIASLAGLLANCIARCYLGGCN